ncbi:MAG: STAS domain-containing protein [Gemmatimonadaceae bacterium]
MTNQESFDVEKVVQPFVAPSHLTADCRLEFRRAALDALDAAVRAGERAVEVDLGATVEIDPSGLGVLILLQKRSRERGLATRLINVPHIVDQLLIVTNLESLFEVVRAR